MSDDINVKRDKIAKYAKWGLGLVGAAVISPFVFLAVKGLIGLALAAVVGVAIINLAPVVSMKFANWKVKAIVSEAMVNPIETLTNLLIEKRKAFESFKENVTTAATAAKNFATKVDGFKKKFPARAPEFEAQLAAMTELVKRKYQALRDAEHSLNEGDAKLDEMKAYWEMSQAAQAANKAAGMDTGDLYEKLKADTAVDAVYTSMNRAFAELETAAALSGPDDTDATPALTHQTSNVIEASFTDKTRVGVARK
jgi:hypothetical protein